MTLDTRLGGHEMNHGETESVGLRLRPVNVAYGVNSAAADAYVKQAGLRGAGTRERDVLAQGFRSHRRWNLHDYGGKLIPGLTYQNFFLGGQDHWQQADITNIDDALRAAMTDTGLDGIMAQYWRGASAQVDTLNRIRLDSVEPALSFYTDDVERLLVQLARSGQFAPEDFASAACNLVLPPGVVLVDGPSPGSTPQADEDAQEHERTQKSVIQIDDESADSLHGLGGYHGSVHITDGHGRMTTIYYSVGVYSEIVAGHVNGIVAFDEPWKNVVATFYHELQELRTDADVADVNRTGGTRSSLKFLGWYSRTGRGEVGDLPINEAPALDEVFKEIALANGSGTVPIQLMWSNTDGGPASP